MHSSDWVIDEKIVLPRVAKEFNLAEGKRQIAKIKNQISKWRNPGAPG